MRVFHASLVALVLSVVSFAASNPVPLIYQPLVPTSVAPGHAAFVLTVHGVGFVPGAVIKGNGIALKTKFVNASTLEAEVPARAVATPNTASITVTNPGSIASNVVYFPVRTPATTLDFGSGPTSLPAGVVGVGDFNHDGRPDIGVANGNCNSGDCAGSLTIFLNKGSGHFQDFAQYQGTLGYTGTTPLQTADVNNDGNLDLAACWSGGDGSGEDIALLNGVGRLSSISRNGDGCGPFADINGDGNLDYVSAGYDGNNYFITVNLGHGDGTFTSLPEIIPDFEPGWLAFGDFNGDGKIDLAVISIYPSTDRVGIFLGNGDGTFQTGQEYQVQYPGPWIAVADVNGDGKLDIVTDGVSVLLGNGDGTFSSSGGVAVSNNFNSGFNSNVEVGDFTGSGSLDVALVSLDEKGNQLLNILLGNGKGAFTGPLTFPAGSSAVAPYNDDIDVADFNNDGMLDVVVGGPTQGIVLLQGTSK